ncbi:helix-turn-helix transcriptional regulator [Leucobacter sp. CSA2]|uniref:Helix-turn-helix transcriptional regulator n=1 Tax=Leucobacter edaphi TaxID=2796472 RepID=A0A934UXW5_9MICO|nr:helix-turn-helix domain-containing protein [Leucobacter edaphi]MBK0421382.1 helix-turn-helix transcriptional regulator [Leucobacter edaphi]
MNERRPRRRPGENREQLVKAGLIEFGLHGYHGASTAAIARRAGVPQPHVYASFPTKLALFEACATRALDLLDGSADPGDAVPGPTIPARSAVAKGEPVSGAAPASAGDGRSSEEAASLLLYQLVAVLADPDTASALSALRTRVIGAFGVSELTGHLSGAAAAILRAGE